MPEQFPPQQPAQPQQPPASPGQVPPDGSPQGAPPAPQEPVWNPQPEQPQPETPQQQAQLVEAMKAKGYRVDDYDSDDALLEAIGDAYSRIDQAPDSEELERLQKLQPVLQDYAANQEAFRQWQEQQRQQEQKPAEPEKPKWQPPEISDTTQRLITAQIITRDPSSGLYKATDPSFAGAAQEANRYLQWQQKIGDRLVKDPVNVLREAGLDDVLSEREQAMRERIEKLEQQLGGVQQQWTRGSVEEDLRQMSPYLFEYDQTNQPVVDPQTKQPKRTAFGQAYSEAAQQRKAELQQAGQEVTEEELHSAGKYAVQLLAKYMPQQQQQAATPEQRREERQDSFLDRTRRNGTNRLPPEERNAVAQAAARETPEPDLEDERGMWERLTQQTLANMGY